MRKGMKIKAASALTVAYVVLFMALERPAFAYLDPGSGSMLIQMIVAAVAGALLSVRLFWSRLKHGVMSLFVREESDSEEKPE